MAWVKNFRHKQLAKSGVRLEGDGHERVSSLFLGGVVVGRAIVLQHVPFEGPARLAPLLLEHGYEIEVRRLDLGTEVPLRLASSDLLVVMGGPMSVGDLDSPAYPFLRREIELLRRVIEDDGPVLGVCLGAQLIAAAAGAAVYPLVGADGQKLYEVGWAPVRFLRSSSSGSILKGVPDEAPVLHWHGDTFDLPRGARRLASSEICENQAFQLGSRSFGLQFHVEVDVAQVATFLEEDAAFVRKARGSDGVEMVREETVRNGARAWEFGQILLGNLLQAMTS